MKYAKKMKLVEIDDNSQLSSLSMPTDENFSTPRILSILDNSMNGILNRHDINDGEKWTLYNQVLQRYLNHIKKLNAKNSVNEQLSNSVQFNDQEHHRTPDTFDNRISNNNISGIFRMKPSIDNISQPTVREFFEQARQRDAIHSSPVSPISFQSLDESNASLNNLPQTPEQTQMSISLPQTDKMRNVTKRQRKRAAAFDLTRIHPNKVCTTYNAQQLQNLQPKQLYRNRQAPQSKYDFIWESTKAK